MERVQRMLVLAADRKAQKWASEHAPVLWGGPKGPTKLVGGGRPQRAHEDALVGGRPQRALRRTS